MPLRFSNSDGAAFHEKNLSAETESLFRNRRTLFRCVEAERVAKKGKEAGKCRLHEKSARRSARGAFLRRARGLFAGAMGILRCGASILNKEPTASLREARNRSEKRRPAASRPRKPKDISRPKGNPVLSCDAARRFQEAHLSPDRRRNPSMTKRNVKEERFRGWENAPFGKCGARRGT